MVSGNRALLSRLCLKLKGEQSSGPKGVNDLCFHTFGGFFPPSPPFWAAASKGRCPAEHRGEFPDICPSFPPSDSDPSLKAQIPASRPKSQTQSPNTSQFGIWASRLEFGPRDWDLRGKGWRRKRRRKRKFPICVKAQVIDPFGAAALLPLQFQAQPTQAGRGYH